MSATTYNRPTESALLHLRRDSAGEIRLCTTVVLPDANLEDPARVPSDIELVMAKMVQAAKAEGVKEL